MHIEAELDDVHSERLLQLQRRLQKPLSEVIAAAIDAALLQQTAPEETQPSPLYRAFDEAGLIGCIETNEQLATTYKQKLDFFHKHGKPQ
ncbi:MAG: hypothetical protein AB1648_09465 [Pseudomonadota bacterium]